MKNKKRILLSIVCYTMLLNSSIYAKELTLEELIKSIKSDSYSKQSADISEKKLDVQEKSIDLDGKNKITLSSNANIYSHNNYGQSTITTSVGYDIFSYRNIHNFDTNDNNNVISVSKDLRFFVN